MKIAFISDVHGNYEALKVVLENIDQADVDHIYCLGDVVGYYAQVNECCKTLIERNIPCLMGNHDWYMASGTGCPRSQSANDCIAYQRKVIKPEYIKWLQTFPVYRNEHNIAMVHGGWNDPIDEYLHEIPQDYFDGIVGNNFVSGHTHVQKVLKFSGKQYCNPGSVGQPRDNDSRAAFAIYDNGKFETFRVKYDMEKVFSLMNEAGFNDYYYGSLKTGSRYLKRLE